MPTSPVCYQGKKSTAKLCLAACFDIIGRFDRLRSDTAIDLAVCFSDARAVRPYCLVILAIRCRYVQNVN